jgi:hypothetical protein
MVVPASMAVGLDPQRPETRLGGGRPWEVAEVVALVLQQRAGQALAVALVGISVS